MLVDYTKQTLQPSWCHFMMTNTSCELCHVIIMSTRVLYFSECLSIYSIISICYIIGQDINKKNYFKLNMCSLYRYVHVSFTVFKYSMYIVALYSTVCTL